MADLCIIASTKSWNSSLADNLLAATGHNFLLISEMKDMTYKRMTELSPRYIFLPHWSHLVPADIFMNFQCVIFHMTDLPFGRGGSPLQNLISRGIYETQISALRCIAEVDAGPIYLKRPLSLHGAAEEIFLRASDVIEKMIIEIINSNIKPAEQVGDPTFFTRRKPAQGNLSNAGSLEQAYDLIRMLDAEGYPHAFISIGNLRLEFTRASRKAGSLLADVKITFDS